MNPSPRSASTRPARCFASGSAPPRSAPRARPRAALLGRWPSDGCISWRPVAPALQPAAVDGQVCGRPAASHGRTSSTCRRGCRGARDPGSPRCGPRRGHEALEEPSPPSMAETRMRGSRGRGGRPAGGCRSGLGHRPGGAPVRPRSRSRSHPADAGRSRRPPLVGAQRELRVAGRWVLPTTGQPVDELRAIVEPDSATRTSSSRTQGCRSSTASGVVTRAVDPKPNPGPIRTRGAEAPLRERLSSIASTVASSTGAPSKLTTPQMPLTTGPR